MRKLLLLIIFAISGCNDSGGLKSYWQNIVRPSQVNLSDLSCSMVGGFFSHSREGYCQFLATETEIQKIVSTLHLRKNPNSVPSNYISKGCSSFLIFNSSQAAAFQVYLEGEKLPPLPGNVSSSFNALYYHPGSGKACTDLYYPYG